MLSLVLEEAWQAVEVSQEEVVVLEPRVFDCVLAFSWEEELH